MIRLVNGAFLSLLLAVLAALFPACASNGGPADTRHGRASITVFAAASLSEVFHDIAGEFEARHPGVTVKLGLAGSQRLRSQLEFGAEADVFASADWLQMDLAVEAGLVDEQPVGFASTGLAVIAANGPGDGAVRTLEDLAGSGVRLALADPGVPVGRYSRQMLEKMSGEGSPYGEDFGSRVLSNLVSNENNVRNVAQKVALGEADAGVVYHPNAARGAASESFRLLPLPEAYDVIATYPITVISGAGRPDLATAFMSFVLSAQGQQILESHGFDRP